VPSQDPPPDSTGSDVPPEKAAARRKAEAIIGRRERAEFNPERLKRPQSVLIGCIMAWIGCARLAFGAYDWTQADSTSSVINQDASPADIDAAVQGLHFFGGVVGFWALVLLTLSMLAFWGHRWAATGLLVLAGISVLVALVGLLTALLSWFVTAAIWSVVSASFVRLREPSKEWYRALREWKAISAGA